MRVLWFTNTSSCYSENGKKTTGGGWISSLEHELKNNSKIELGVCFYYGKSGKEIINGTNIYKMYPQGSILSAVGIINNQKEIIFITEGYNKDFKHIRSIPMIKWEIIKKYISNGCTKFDLGDISISKNYTTKSGYNGNIIEYSNTFDLVINDMMYKLNNMTKKK